MKHIAILCGISILLTGCETSYNLAVAIFSEKEKGYLTDKNDRLISDCRGRLISNEYEAPKFWQDNNLPKGTTDFVCKDGKAYLPNKATDCQGKPLSSYPNGIMGFKQRYNFPRNHTGNIVGYTRFTCENGVPTPFDKKD